MAEGGRRERKYNGEGREEGLREDGWPALGMISDKGTVLGRRSYTQAYIIKYPPLYKSGPKRTKKKTRESGHLPVVSPTARALLHGSRGSGRDTPPSNPSLGRT